MATVVSEGSLTQIDPAPSSNWFGGTSMSLDLYTTIADYGSIYRTQPAVRQVVSFIARNIAQLGLHTFRRISDNERERLTAHPFPRLMSSPNPPRRLTAYTLFDSMIQDRAIYGRAHWAKITLPGQKQPAALQRLFPWRLIPVGSPSKVDYYRYVGSRGHVDFAPEQVVTFKFYDPGSDTYGVSPLESLRRVLAEDAAAGDYRERFWRRGAKMSGIIERPPKGTSTSGGIVPDWSPEAKDRFMGDWNAMNAGSGPNVGGTAVLQDGMHYVPIGSTFRDAQFMEGRKFTLEEAAGQFHIPPPMVGLLDNANYSNALIFHQMLYQDALGPDLEMIQQEVEAQLLPDFPDVENVYTEFNIAAKLQGSFIEEANALSLAVGGPWMARAEARARKNLPPFDDPEQQAAAEELITPMNVTVGGQAAPNAPQPAKSADDVIREVRERQRGSVLSKAGAVGEPTLDVIWHGAKWDTDLALALIGVVDGPEQKAVEVNAETKRAVTAALEQSDPIPALRAAFRRLTS